MQHSRQDAHSPDNLNKLMNSVVFFDLDEMVRVTNKAIERGNNSTVVLNVCGCDSQTTKVKAQRNDRYKQTCSESPQANR